MPELRIDGRAVTASPGETLLSAARSLGVHVPTLCYREGAPRHTSCMVCLVEDVTTGRLVPACATAVQEGMDIRTGGARVAAARRRSVELLASEHRGDCEAPCARACPAHADIPAVMRLLARGDAAAARARLHACLPLAGTLARTCPAPCRRACRRGRVDSPVDICGVKAALTMPGGTMLGGAMLGGAAPGEAVPGVGEAHPGSGKKVAIVGAGPAGLSAAWFLSRAGHHCVVVDDRPEPGGMLRAGLSAEVLPLEVFETDMAILRDAGMEFRLNCRVLPGPGVETLRKVFDAVLLATGSTVSREAGVFSIPGIFVCGNAARETPSRIAARAVGEGREAARRIRLFLECQEDGPEPRRFDSRRGALPAPVLTELAAAATRRAQRRKGNGSVTAPDAPAVSEQLASEAARCLQCDCVRKRSCRLRELATDLGADGARFTADRREAGCVLEGRNGLSLDTGKCIKCGVCVMMAEAAKAAPGLAFRGRGAATRVCVPLGGDFGEAVAEIAHDLVKCCPTGALAWDI